MAQYLLNVCSKINGGCVRPNNISEVTDKMKRNLLSNAVMALGGVGYYVAATAYFLNKFTTILFQ